ncbi:MAG: FliH/SctL family protein [Planctomycetota bacterium]
MVRRADAEQIARDALVLDLGDLARTGDDLRERARAEAASVVEEALRERARIIDGAHDEGFAKGLDEGLAKGQAAGEASGRERAYAESREKIDAVLGAWSKSFGEFEAARGDMLESARTDAVRLAVLLATKIVARVVEVDEGVAVEQLASALARLARRTALVIRVNPEDEASVREVLPALMQRFDRVEHAELRADPGVSRGGCVVGTDASGEIDATIETKLERLAGELVPSGDAA